MNRVGGNTATGIDIGNDRVRVVQIRRSGHSYSIVKVGNATLAELGRIDDSKRKDARIAMVLHNVLKESRIRPAGAVATVSSKRVLIKYTQIPPVPSWKLRMLMEYEIDAEKSGGRAEVATDFRLLDLPVMSDRYTVLMAMVQKEAVEERMELLREAGVKPTDITISPVGQYESFVHSCVGPSEGVTLVVAVGAVFTDLVFAEGGKFYFARTVQMGGRAFTDAVAKELGINFQEAEEMKRSGIESMSKVDDPLLDTERISNALHGPAEQLVSNIESAILFCRAQTKMVDMKISKILLSGGGGMLDGLDKFLSSQLELPVSRVDPLEAIEVSKLPSEQKEELQREAPAYAQAVGLALAGLKDESFFLSVFPEEVKKRRRFLNRELFLWYAAALFLISVGIISAALLSTRYRRQGYLKIQKERVENAAKESGGLEKLVSENRMLAARTAALEDRIVVGRQCVEVLGVLKKVTPEEIRLLGLEVDETQKGAMKSERLYDVRRWLYIKGLVKSPKTQTAGEEILRRYTEELRKQNLFADAKIQPKYAYKNDQVYFEMKIDIES